MLSAAEDPPPEPVDAPELRDEGVDVAVVREALLDVLWPLRALASVSWVAARFACCAVSCAWRTLVSSVASVWPAVTA